MGASTRAYGLLRPIENARIGGGVQYAAYSEQVLVPVISNI